MINPTQLLVKTAANYIAFKAVKTTVDGTWNRKAHKFQYQKASECQLCLSVWSNDPPECLNCGCKAMKKLYRDYEFKKYDENGLEVDSNLTLIQGGRM